MRSFQISVAFYSFFVWIKSEWSKAKQTEYAPMNSPDWLAVEIFPSLVLKYEVIKPHEG